MRPRMSIGTVVVVTSVTAGLLGEMRQSSSVPLSSPLPSGLLTVFVVLVIGRGAPHSPSPKQLSRCRFVAPAYRTLNSFPVAASRS